MSIIMVKRFLIIIATETLLIMKKGYSLELPTLIFIILQKT